MMFVFFLAEFRDYALKFFQFIIKEAQKFFTERKSRMSKDEAQAKALAVLGKVKERPVLF